MLYERDYHLGLTETEEQQYEEITGRKFWEKRVSGFGRVNNFMAYPKAARMCKSLFPNNYLDVRWREICNNKKIKRHDNGVSYEPIQDCLWPSSKLSKLPEISAYVEKLEEIKGKKVYYCFRNAGYKYTAGIFSNLVNRDMGYHSGL